MLYFILIILFLTIILYLIYKDYLKVLKLSSIISGISGILTLIIGYIIKNFINNKIMFINVSKITNIILTKFLKNSIYLLILSLIEILIYYFIKLYLRKEIKV